MVTVTGVPAGPKPAPSMVTRVPPVSRPAPGASETSSPTFSVTVTGALVAVPSLTG